MAHLPIPNTEHRTGNGYHFGVFSITWPGIKPTQRSTTTSHLSLRVDTLIRDHWADGWIDGWIDRWTDGWMFFLIVFIFWGAAVSPWFDHSQKKKSSLVEGFSPMLQSILALKEELWQLPFHAWFLSRSSDFLTPSGDMHVRVTCNFTLFAQCRMSGDRKLEVLYWSLRWKRG